jgi:hypothetical protein
MEIEVNMYQYMITESDEGSELFRLKRRFLKDREQSRIFFAKQQTRIKQMREVCSVTYMMFYFFIYLLFIITLYNQIQK